MTTNKMEFNNPDSEICLPDISTKSLAKPKKHMAIKENNTRKNSDVIISVPEKKVESKQF